MTTLTRSSWKDLDEVTDRRGEPIKAGTRARIPAGTPIHGTFKAHRKVAGTTYSVVVDHVAPGYEDPQEPRYSRLPEITWAGTGGYWHRCDPSLVEALY
jgi:hypothetical protein